MMTERRKLDELKKENEIKYWFDVYNKVYENFNQAQDYYFKRTQILMFAIQIGLATAFVKLLTANTEKSFLSEYTIYVLLGISFLGIVFCFLWLSMIQRHWNVMEYCRCYMRYIEGHLMELGIPLAIFRVESAIFHRQRHVFFGDKYEEDRNRFFQKEFPYEGMKAKIKLMKLEKWVVYIIVCIWNVSLSILLYQTLINYKDRFPSCIFYVIMIIIAIIFVLLIILPIIIWIKDKKDGLPFSVSQEFQAELGKEGISDKLRHEFENYRIKLSKGSTVKKKGHTWQIEDGHCSYIIKKESDKLNIYRGKNNQTILFWDLKEDFVRCPEKDN